MFITRRVEFSASHVCANAAWTEAKNRAVYGLAANPRGHGHNYVLEVTLSGDPDPSTGMVFDLKDLKEIVNVAVVDPMDHRFLNYEVPPFDHLVPTVENVAIEVWKRLQPKFGNGRVRLYNIRLYETDDLYVDYAGGSDLCA